MFLPLILFIYNAGKKTKYKLYLNAKTIAK